MEKVGGSEGFWEAEDLGGIDQKNREVWLLTWQEVGSESAKIFIIISKFSYSSPSGAKGWVCKIYGFVT